MSVDVEERPRKRTRDAAATRARILATARAEFVAHGLSGARVERIAEGSGVNKNLIYHYFVSKDDLYLAVIETIYGSLREQQNDDQLCGMAPVDALARLVTTTFDHFVATPDLIRLMSVENIHNAEHLRRSTGIKPLYGGLVETIETILRRGVAEGRFRPGIDAVDLYLSISGLAYFFLSNQHTLSWLLDRDFVTPERIAARRAHVAEMVLGYVMPPPAAEAPLHPIAATKRRTGE